MTEKLGKIIGYLYSQRHNPVISIELNESNYVFSLYLRDTLLQSDKSILLKLIEKFPEYDIMYDVSTAVFHVTI